MLTPQEQAELQMIEQELTQRQKAGFVQPKGLTAMEAEEIAAIEAELAQRESAKTIPGEEADLGILNRLKYSIEPLESNRKALLIKEFGAENVKEDAEGNSYIRQGNAFRPVNKEGFSVADVADIIGATPEILGAGAGAVAGLGAGSIPAAIAGGAAGSVARQGLSALIGNPQVSTPIERASEIGLSAVMGGAGAGAGKLMGKAGKVALPKLAKAFPKINIGKEGAKIIQLSKSLNIPEPTPGQIAGGRTLEIEKALGFRRFWGRKIRNQTEKQIEAIKKNLANEVGDFIDTESGRDLAGQKIKEIAQSSVKAVKNQASQLFDEVAEESSKIAIPADKMQKDLLFNFQKLGLFDTNGNPLKHTSRTGMTLNEFKRVQDVFGKILNDIPGSATDMVDGVINIRKKGEFIDAKTLNTMRRFIDANIKEGKIEGVDNYLLLKLRENFLDITERALGAKSPQLKTKFQTARSLWGKQLRLSEQLERGGQSSLLNMSDEKVLDKFFSSKKGVRQLKELVGSGASEKAGLSWVNDMLTKKLGQEDKITAQAALNVLKDKREAIIEAIGRKKYNRIKDNLFYLERIGRPINPSRTGIIDLFSLDLKQIATGGLERAVYGARATAESLQRNIPKYLERIPSQGAKGLSALTDQTQRELGYLTRNPALRAPQSEGGSRGRK